MKRHTGPVCSSCNCTETSHLRAAVQGWKRVMGTYKCRVCAERFPAHLRRTF